MTVFHVVSTSGGKDSTATLLIALERFGRDRVIPIFCDTGNEHEATYRYLDYLEERLGVKIRRLGITFDEEIARKRVFIARDVRHGRLYKRVPILHPDGQPVVRLNSDGTPQLRMVFTRDGGFDLEGIPRMRKAGGRRVRWSNKAKRRALSVLHPSGNQFLDLCLWKGRFPSRKAQFCTQHLKRDVAVEFQLDLVEQGHRVVSWQGVRRDESLNRRDAIKFERVGGRIYAHRPIVDWTAADVFAFCASRQVDPNPLYLQGMTRVGCMPCINVSKPELREIAVRFPGHIDRIAQWEALVSQASKRGFSTFSTDGSDEPDRREIFAALNIRARVDWSRTGRGGRQFDMFFTSDTPIEACASSYGLCE